MARDNRLPSVSSPFRFPAGVDYVALRPILVGGVALNKGDHLPADSPLRALPHRLEILCRRRHLSPVMSVPEMAPVATPKTPKLELIVSQVVEEDFASLSAPAAPPPPSAKKEVAKAVPPKPAPKVAVRDFSTMTIAQLRAQAKLTGIPYYGSKKDVLDRLRKASPR